MDGLSGSGWLWQWTLWQWTLAVDSLTVDGWSVGVVFIVLYYNYNYLKVVF